MNGKDKDGCVHSTTGASSSPSIFNGVTHCARLFYWRHLDDRKIYTLPYGNLIIDETTDPVTCFLCLGAA